MHLRMRDYTKDIPAILERARLTQAQFGERLGVTQGTVSRWLRGSVPEPAQQEAIARFEEQAFGIARARRNEIPVIGFASAGSDSVLFAGGEGAFEYVKAPDGATDQTVAVEVRGNSLGPLFDRWLVFYDNIHDPPTIRLLNRLCVIGLPDGRIVVKKLQRGQRRNRFTLISNIEPPIYDAEVAWAAEAIAMRPRN